jgi:hypothetical protein
LDVDMPRETTFRVELQGRHGNAFKVDSASASILQQRGWTIEGKGTHYHYVNPPDGQSVSKHVEVRFEVPTDGEMIAVASRLHCDAQPNLPIFERVFGCPFLYLPAHTVLITTEEIDLLGINGAEWIPPPPQTSQQKERAICRIGFGSLWEAEVRWADDGTPMLTKYPKCEIKNDNQQLLFEEPVDLGHDLFDRKDFGSSAYVEGELEQVLVNVYERDRNARSACLAHHGTTCIVCGFNFYEKYGEIGHGFVHVHHVKPLCEIGERYIVDPVRDLRPVCPNCHAMLHRKTPCLTVEQLRAILRA